MLTATQIDYNPATHTSRAPDGRDVPHVTHILTETRLATDFEQLLARGGRAAETIEQARLRGTAVHADCHAYDDGDLDWGTVHPVVLPYLNAWIRCCEEKGLVPIAHARERQVFSATHWYTGFLDGLFAYGPLTVLVDLKTGDPDDAACHLQTMAYQLAWEAEHPDQRIDERWAIQLVPQARVPYRITNYTRRPGAHADLGKWLAALCTFNEQPGRRTV